MLPLRHPANLCRNRRAGNFHIQHRGKGLLALSTLLKIGSALPAHANEPKAASPIDSFYRVDRRLKLGMLFAHQYLHS